MLRQIKLDSHPVLHLTAKRLIDKNIYDLYTTVLKMLKTKLQIKYRYVLMAITKLEFS